MYRKDKNVIKSWKTDKSVSEYSLVVSYINKHNNESWVPKKVGNFLTK